MLFTSKGVAQNSFGLEFGTYFEAYNGINDFDSIRVITTGSDYGEMFGGIFHEVKFTKRLTLHSKFLIRPIYINYTVFNNKEQCQFCPVKKGALSAVTNMSFELLPQLELLKLNVLKIKIFGGMNTSFNFSSKRSDISFNGRHPGVARVINSLDQVVDPVTFSLIYGACAEYKRFIFWVKYQQSSKYSGKLEISNKNYNFDNTWEFLSFSMGYRFYKLQTGKKKLANNK